MQKEIWDLAQKLLDSWEYLKEVFKIPKIMHRERREHEKDLDAKRDSMSISFRDGDSSSARSSRDRRSDRDRGERSGDRDRDGGRDSSSVGRYSSSDRKRKHSPDSARDSPKDGGGSLSRSLSGPTPNKLSKFEHRRLFEEKVKLEDTLRERQKMRQQQQQHCQPPMPQQLQHQQESIQLQPPLPQQQPPLPQSQPPLPPPPQQQQQPPPPQMWCQEGWNHGNAGGMQGPYQGGMPSFHDFMPPTGPPPSGPPPMSGPPGPMGNFMGQPGGFFPPGGPSFQNQQQYQEPAEPVMIPVVGKFFTVFFVIFGSFKHHGPLTFLISGAFHPHLISSPSPHPADPNNPHAVIYVPAPAPTEERKPKSSRTSIAPQQQQQPSLPPLPPPEPALAYQKQQPQQPSVPVSLPSVLEQLISHIPLPTSTAAPPKDVQHSPLPPGMTSATTLFRITGQEPWELFLVLWFV